MAADARPHLVIGGLLHELRQPLGAIRTLVAGGLHLLNEPGFNPDRLRSPLRRIGAEADRVDKILHNLPRLLLRDEVPNRDATSINSLIMEAARLAANAAGVDMRSIDFDLAQPLPVLRLDAVLVRQALLNVILNGLEAGRRRPGAKRLHIASRLTADRSVRVSVRDQGPGCASSVLGRLGEPFYTTKRGGTGLGLWLVRSIVEAHGGDIKVRRIPRGGLSIQLTFRSCR